MVQVPEITVDGWADCALDLRSCAGDVLGPLFDPLPAASMLPRAIRISPSPDGYVRVRPQPAGSTTAEIELCWDMKWVTQFVAQLGHEFGHVVANNWLQPFTPGAYHWIEEACCEGLRLLTYKLIAEAWKNHSMEHCRTADMQGCYRIETDKKDLPKLTSEVDARHWYVTNAPRIHSLDTSGEYLPLRPAAVWLCDWFAQDRGRIAGLMGRNGWSLGEEFDRGHYAMWVETCRKRNVSSDLADFVRVGFFR